MQCNFFASWESAESIAKFKKSTDENVRTYMELRGVSWSEVMIMPYHFFIGDLKWKVDLEEEKRKKMEESHRASRDKAHRELKAKNMRK